MPINNAVREVVDDCGEQQIARLGERLHPSYGFGESVQFRFDVLIYHGDALQFGRAD
ncbi:MAG TPA: hypothetical protein VEH77_08245 [Roseiarcus sp.]|nr:hypothetical protein [Roseiarcus sp.]